ncbi:decapping and exoribonuclease protein-like [Uloborus diversus]|uniref:decapping and exoribonuclease protein-like n=1 Tax=Uloborus diversus TaxID=327109 RepID=UPI00240A4BB4|nr:decapping and exoribonuclease protein-like [Uloborus diversus]
MSKKTEKNVVKTFSLPLTTREKKAELTSTKEIGSFSINKDRVYFHDASELKFYVPRDNPVYLDLNVGLTNPSYQARADILDDSEKMDHILKWIVEDKFKLFKEDNRVDFISHRGTLKKIMLLDIDNPEDKWSICATRFKGRIYMVAVFNDSGSEVSEQNKRSSAWGYKFEEYMISDQPGGEPRVDSTTHELEEFCIVVQSKLSDYTLAYKVEIDGIHSDRLDEESPQCYVELKTFDRTLMKEIWGSYKTRKKFFDHWIHIHFAGIKTIVFGLKDKNGIVTEVEEMEASDLLSKTRGSWNVDKQLQYVDSFLTLLKDNVTQDDPNVVYKFEIQPNGKKIIQCTEMRNFDEKYRILPQWYVTAYKENDPPSGSFSSSV